MHGRVARWIGLLGIAAFGCTGDDTPEPPRPSPFLEVKQVEVFRTGVVRGVVRWKGSLPAEESPHLPRVDPQTSGVRDAIVMLRGAGQSASAKWPHGPILIELRDKQIRILQDGHSSSVGIARVGDDIEVVNRDSEPHVLRGRGAARFAIPLPEPDRVAKRSLTRTGIVTLSSGANHPAMSAHLFVAETLCVARTNAEGEFILPDVPEGSHTLACWMPSWNLQRRERDPGSGLVSRLHYEPPVERTATIRVEAGRTTATSFAWSLDDFAGK
jgi:hypothetical protein